MTPDNVHKVPFKQWRRWCHETRAFFNRAYPELATGFQNAMLPPSLQKTINEKQARVLGWNAAWTAADVMEKTLREFTPATPPIE